ncbi:xylose isomerase [Burkholderia sp. SRS-W-2-2016]|uniref:sugar phosphate isomerase/epimerase family protein n=1 Tax=Burkholderia sp. SRS-W-2-2016 TaxID=1926878 RepID=UPI00094AF1F6|nr:TIM barrel protein [Burkholderia sp. SRS-W-2-2016]OLL32547.1 xylose isomerase [Burkholderia sp. SRS-W-2-2016]
MKPALGTARPLALAHLTALDVEPVQWVRAAARAGFAAVGLRLYPATEGGIAYLSAPGSEAHRALRDTLAGEGLVVHDVEFVPVVPELDPASLSGLFEAAASLGARCVSVSGDDPDSARLAVKLAELAERAQPFGLRIDLEFMRWRHVGSLAQARAVIARAAHSNLALLVDALHLSRSGGTPDDIAALPPAAIGAVQLCDAPALQPETDDDAIREARMNRMAPGAGALPLDALLRAVSPEVALSVEMPMPSLPLDARLELAYRSAHRVVERAALAMPATISNTTPITCTAPATNWTATP